MRTSKKDYYNKLLDKNRSNIKGLWNVLNSIIRNGVRGTSYPSYFIENGKTIKNMDEVVSGFNKFFVNVGPELANQINMETANEDVDDFNFERNPNSIFIKAVEEKEIIDIVRNFKNKISTDCDEIDMTIVKKVIDGILKPLTYICNLSFQTGKFPNKMKVAKVIPLYKTGDKHIFTNYRPVSLLSQFSKVLEKLFSKRLDGFIEKHKLLTESQYGFRENRSTSLALMELIEEITNCIENKYAIGIFIDLKKAFDTINHDILLDKLERYGIRGVGLKWLSSYLIDRQQFVKLGDYKSTLLDIKCGVPQGSILGPKLFILYINDICKVSDVFKFVLFADDTNIFCSGDNMQHLLNMITSEMNKLKKWFDRNKLSLNLNKTKIMLFGNRKIDSKESEFIATMNIERVYQIKFLGVILDHKICWKPHIAYVRAKLARSVAILGKTRLILNQRTLYILYCSLVLPYLNYCLEIWGNTYKSNLQPLIILQKRAIRIVNNVGFQEHTNSLFLLLNTLKLIDMVNFKTAQIIFKARNNLLPGNIQNMFFEREGGYNLRGEHKLKQLLIKTTRRSQCIAICGVKLWNGLDREIQESNNIFKFKKMYKNQIINSYRVEERG